MGLGILDPLPEEVPDEEQQQQHEESERTPVFDSHSVPLPPSRKTRLNYSPLNWKEFFDHDEDVHIPNSNDVFHLYIAGTEGPIVFCLHGAGYSGLSFSLSSRKMKEIACVVSMDMRGHGRTCTEDDHDLSIETLRNDVLAVIKTKYGDHPPAIILVGHSMGGSVAVHVAATKALSSLAGLVVVDVIEETASASLIHMPKILSNRIQQQFSSIEKAIACTFHGGSIRNIDSARVSVPTTLTLDSSRNCYIYRACLEGTEKYWKGWYAGLSEKFISCHVPKLLLLAGNNTLDSALTIDHMRGKFQMLVMKNAGHAIQEDVPDEFAAVILNFICHNRIGPTGIQMPVFQWGTGRHDS